MSKEKQEKIKNIALIVLGIIVFLGIMYFVSENIGDRSKDKDPNNYQTSEGTNDGSSTNPLLEEGEEIKDEERKSLPTMTFAELEEALKKEDRKIIFLGSESCGWCNYQMPILEHVLYTHEGVEVYYMNVAALTQDEYNQLSALHSDLAGFGTPTFIVIDGGKVTAVDQGARGTSGILALLKQHNFISE